VHPALALLEGDSLLSELGKGTVALPEVLQAHRAQDGVGLGELDIGVLDDLEEIAPGVEDVVSPYLRAGFAGSGQSPLAVVDDDPDVALLIRRLRPPFRERDELVAHVDERHPPPAPAQRQLEDPGVEVERLLDAADLEGDVVDADEASASVHARIFADESTSKLLQRSICRGGVEGRSPRGSRLGQRDRGLAGGGHAGAGSLD
jgi:hypothetical protein